MEQDYREFEEIREGMRKTEKIFDDWVKETKRSMEADKALHSKLVAEEKGFPFL